MAMYYVSPDGNDDNSGESIADAVRHVAVGLTKLHPGDTLLLAGGVYAEHVTLEKLVRVEIRSVEGEHAVIDGAIDDFRTAPEDQWRPGVVDGEFVSSLPWDPNTNRGAFLGDGRYTRLLTYDRLEDLRAENETFGPLLDGEGPEGPVIKVAAGELLKKRPWVYMGPGLYQGGDGHVHVRLRHTTLDVEGVQNYSGPQDARELPLAIWRAPTPIVKIIGCTSVRLNHLTVRFGGGPSIALDKSNDVWIDHVRVQAGAYGIRIGEKCQRTIITNTAVDGGLPPWHFRSDRKSSYTIADSGEVNALAEQTLKSLLACVPSSGSTTVEHCEIAHGHDVQLNGSKCVFRANWVHDINDDAVFVGKSAVGLRITRNVFEQCLTVLSLASKSTAGPVHVHRNLVDLRRTTRHRRPQPNPDHVPHDERPELRFGNFFKSNFADPDLNVFHNTVVIVQRTRAVHNIFRAYDGASRRQVYNNIFVGIDNGDATDQPLAYLPRLTDDAATDGNCYCGIRRNPAILLQVRDEGRAGSFHGLDDPDAVDYFQQSELLHPPGFEKNGTDENPRLRRFWNPISFPPTEDLRLAEGSPAAVPGGVPLTDPVLREIDGNPPLTVRPTIGCYPFGAPPMAVGVDGLTFFPSNPLGPF